MRNPRFALLGIDPSLAKRWLRGLRRAGMPARGPQLRLAPAYSPNSCSSLAEPEFRCPRAKATASEHRPTLPPIPRYGPGGGDRCIGNALLGVARAPLRRGNGETK